MQKNQPLPQRVANAQKNAKRKKRNHA